MTRSRWCWWPRLAAAGPGRRCRPGRRGPPGPRCSPCPYLLGAAGSACLAAAGAGALAGNEVVLRVPGLLGPRTLGPAADPLSGLFLVLSFSAAVAVSLALASWAAGPDRPRRRGLGTSYALASARSRWC